MALDVLRAIAKTGGESLKAFATRVKAIADRFELLILEHQKALECNGKLGLNEQDLCVPRSTLRFCK